MKIEIKIKANRHVIENFIFYISDYDLDYQDMLLDDILQVIKKYEARKSGNRTLD